MIVHIRLVVMLLLLPTGIIASEPEFANLTSLGNTQYVLHRSAQLDHDYHIYISLPDQPEAGKLYPTIYLLDGGITFPLLASYSRYLMLANEIPDVIVVGISYGTNDWREGNRRGTDYTAPSDEREHYGGAAAFQNMLKHELIPLVEKNWPSDPEQRILFGQSLGGQFAIFNAITDPSLFSGLIASNPALHRNLDYFLEWQGRQTQPVNSTRLFVSLAQFDDQQYAVPAGQWVKHWQDISARPFHLDVRKLPGHNHFSAAPEAYRHGLGWILGE